jgi:hypothetical protein
MEQAREIRAQRELAQELGTRLGSLPGYTRLLIPSIFQTMYRNSRGQSYPVNRSKLIALTDASPRVGAAMMTTPMIVLALEVRVNFLIMSRPRW